MAIKHCMVCGSRFEAPPSGRKTCSRACSLNLRSISHTGVSNAWSDEARQRLRDKAVPGQLSKGAAAAMLLPEGQCGQLHRDSMVWQLIAPDGTHIVAIGLEDWARRNCRRFGETEDTAHRIAAGIRQIAQSMRGRTKRRVSSYKGWGLADLPAEKNKEETP